MNSELLYGLKQKDIEKINACFSNYPQIEKAVLYGSRAMGNFRPSSDIDLTLIGHQLGLKELFQIENDLDDLLLPYKIDLSILHHISNTDLREHISRVGKVFYDKQKQGVLDEKS